MGLIEKNAAGRESAAEGTNLIARLRNGEQQALSELHDRYAKLIHALALRVLQDSFAAEEVLQDVFSRLSHNPEVFETESASLMAWLMANGRNPPSVSLCGPSSEIATEQRVIGGSTGQGSH